MRTSTATFDLVPRPVEAQRAWLTERSGAFAAIVAVEAEARRVVGFASLSPYKETMGGTPKYERPFFVRSIWHDGEFTYHLHIGIQEPGGEWSNPYPLMRRLYNRAAERDR